MDGVAASLGNRATACAGCAEIADNHNARTTIATGPNARGTGAARCATTAAASIGYARATVASRC